MTYTITFSDTSKTSFTIEELKKDGPGSLDGTHTDLVFYGKGNSDYGEDLWNNLIHMLENFSSAGPGPNNPIEGQLWYNNVDRLLSIYKAVAPATNPKTYAWSVILDANSLSNPTVINSIISGLTAALSDPTNTATSSLLTALGDSYIKTTGGTLTGPLNIHPYNTDATNDPLQNDKLAVSVSYLKSYVANKLNTLDLSTLIGFDIPPFDATLDAGYGGYYLKKVLDATYVDGTAASAQISQSNIILPTYNTDVQNPKFAASREYVDAKILDFSKTFVKKIIWTDTLNLANGLITGTLTASLPTGFNYIAIPSVTMTPSLSDATLHVNSNATNNTITISYSGTTSATRVLSKISIASSQITGVAGYIDSDSLVYNINIVSSTIPATTTTRAPTTTTTVAGSTTTTTAVATSTTTAVPTSTTTIAPTTSTTAVPTPTLFEGGYWFGQDATYNYYISPNSLETPNRITYSDAVAYCNNITVLGNASYKWQIPSVAEFTMLFNYKNNLSSVVAFNLAYWTTDTDSSNYWKKIFIVSDGSTTFFNPTNGVADSNTMWTRPIRKVPK
jgi:hypothetical protein